MNSYHLNFLWAKLFNSRFWDDPERLTTSFLIRSMLSFHRRQIKHKPGLYPFEHAKKIIIDDTKGLEELLYLTAASCEKEWATFLRTELDESTVRINSILSPYDSSISTLVPYTDKGGCTLNLDQAHIQKYTGYVHFHTDDFEFPACSYAISTIDRFKPNNWINLLTFNLPGIGPELVGFNQMYTYLPVDDSKQVLICSSFLDIWRYLNKLK